MDKILLLFQRVGIISLVALIFVICLCLFIEHIKFEYDCKKSWFDVKKTKRKRKKPKFFVAVSCGRICSWSTEWYFSVEGKVLVGDFVLGYLPNGTLKLLTVSNCCYHACDKESVVYFKVEEE